MMGEVVGEVPPLLTTIINMDRISLSNFMGSGAPFLYASGTRTPVYGAGGGTYPPSGWTGLQNSSVDDSFVNVPLGFNFYMFGTAYSTVFVGSNTYLTFGSGSTVYSGLSASNPALVKFHLGAADNSYQRVSYYNHPSNFYTIIRYEGNGSTSGTVGSPGIVYEATLYNPFHTWSNQTLLEVRVGNHNRTSGIFGVYTAAGSGIGTSISANQNYVFYGAELGNSWNILSGYYVTGTS